MNDTDNKGTAPAVIPTEIVQVERAEDIISIAQRRVEFIGQLKILSLRITNFQDWMNVENQPYLGHSGAEKVARLWGVKLHNLKTEKVWSEDSKGQFYIYRTTGTAELPKGYDSIEAIGTCSQRDKFFGFAQGGWKDTVDIDETNIMKASYSNFVVNAITHLLGLRNLTWDDLKAANIDQGKVQKVEYGKGAETVRSTLSPELQKKQRDIWAICLQLGAGDATEAKTFLKQASKFKGKDKEGNPQDVFVDDVRRLTTDRWLNMTLSNVTAAFKKAYPNEDVPSAGEQENLL